MQRFRQFRELWFACREYLAVHTAPAQIGIRRQCFERIPCIARVHAPNLPVGSDRLGWRQPPTMALSRKSAKSGPALPASPRQPPLVIGIVMFWIWSGFSENAVRPR